MNQIAPTLRLFLLISGLVLISGSLAILVYALWPNPPIEELILLSPTLFIPP